MHYDEIGLVNEKDVIIDKEPIIHIDDLIKSNNFAYVLHIYNIFFSYILCGILLKLLV